MHVVPDLKVLYFGTPVVVISSRNEDGTTNLAPMSSAWWLGQSCLLGLSNYSQTAANLKRDGEAVLNLPDAGLVDAVDRLALTTGRRDVPDYKRRQGYQYMPDKFAVGGLNAQPSDTVRPQRVMQCPIQLECRVVSTRAFGAPAVDATAFEVQISRTHVEEHLLIPGTSHVDPVRWDPLIMKFTEFFGEGRNVYPSRLAAGWNMPVLAREADQL
ncbi:flavin reductase family protein [Actinoplanes sp. NPDC051346]|uniref:flavin reductase family protein n=1 Tax=Actinoplanes sp. NPDC051346 TaxID=3155048 RepID=UPI00342CE0E4